MKKKTSARKKQPQVVPLSLEQYVRVKIPLPKGLFWIEGDGLARYKQSRWITAVVLFLAKNREEGGIFYAPLLIGWQRHRQGGAALEERVRQHIANFQTALKLGTAPYAEGGGVLELRPEVPRDARTDRD